MHQRVPQHVNHLERQRVNQAEHQLVNRLLCVSSQMHRPVNHLLYASSQTHQRVQTVSQAMFLSNDQTEHPGIVVVIVEVVPEGAVVLVGVVLEEAVVGDGKTEYNFIPGKRHVTRDFFLNLIQGFKF